LLLCGISLFIFGKEITKVILFPLLFLLFMFPLPEAFISPLANPMKMYVAKFAASFVDLLGIPVFREGYYINTINGEVLVGNPCSGLRSLISFLAIGTYFAYFLRASKIRKLLLPCLSIPIALGCNALRVVSLVLVTHYYGSAKASPDSFFHDFSGFMVFFIGSIILLGIWGVLEWKD
jgi:exosortase